MSHRKSNKRHSARGFVDVTLNDFANSAVAKSRPRKSINNVKVVLKQEVEKNWDEKDEEEFEGEFLARENEDGTVSYIIQKVVPRVRKKSNSVSECCDRDDFGNVYPIDIWYLVSEFIRPEDVGVFAAICKSSLEVVCSAKFWFSLYRRYYKSVPNLPESLQPECLVRKYGLRTAVIRALYYMYDPFIHKLKHTTTELHQGDDPSRVEKYQCNLIWYRVRKSTCWVYYLKMKQNSTSSVHFRNTSSKPDLLQILDDVSANPEENCRILRITCCHFIQVPQVIGLTLTTASVTLSRNITQYRLQLVFGSGIKSSSKHTEAAGSTVMIFDPVINIKVLDWWHPLYPHSDNMENLLNFLEIFNPSS